MKDGDNTPENVGEVKDAQDLASDTVADGNDDLNSTVNPPVSIAVIDSPLIEQFEVRQPPLVMPCFPVLYDTRQLMMVTGRL
jgi:hypothetical protein